MKELFYLSQNLLCLIMGMIFAYKAANNKDKQDAAIDLLWANLFLVLLLVTRLVI